MKKEISSFAEDVQQAVNALKNGGTLLYPTDTIWGIGCDASNVKAIKKVHKLKERPLSKNMIILVEDKARLEHHVREVPETLCDLIQSVNKPLSIIFPHARNLPKELIADDGTIAIRITQHPFCKAMITQLGHPLVSTSANLSGSPAPTSFETISQQIRERVNHIVPSSYETKGNNLTASTLIRLHSDGTFEVLRR
ncbi:MAG: threonylcarbamoyl-AMP synthase [Bacteroidetes bacterium]|nr:MAG: threonylcarbamoyl-AMP synthase [Bacteroidota bacterium]